MTILITGGAGFIGSYMTEYLLGKECEVLSLDNLSTGILSNVDRFAIYPNFHFHQGSVLDEGLVERLVRQSDAIIHLANPVDINDFKDLVVHFAERFQKRIIVMSEAGIDEKDAEMSVRNYFSVKQTPITVVRFSNVVGVGSEENILLKYFDQARTNEAIEMFGVGEEICNFSDVRDVINALYTALIDQETYGEFFDVGSPEEVSLQRLGELVKTITRSKASVKLASSASPELSGILRLFPKSDKLKKLTGFRFKFKIKDSLSWIYRDYKAKAKVVDLIKKSPSPTALM